MITGQTGQGVPDYRARDVCVRLPGQGTSMYDYWANCTRDV